MKLPASTLVTLIGLLVLLVMVVLNTTYQKHWSPATACWVMSMLIDRSPALAGAAAAPGAASTTTLPAASSAAIPVIIART